MIFVVSLDLLRWEAIACRPILRLGEIGDMIPFHGEVLGLRWPCGPWARRSFHTTPRVAWLPSPRDQGGEAQGATSSARAGVSLVVAVSSFGGAPRPLRNRSKSAQNRSKTCRKMVVLRSNGPFQTPQIASIRPHPNPRFGAAGPNFAARPVKAPANSRIVGRFKPTDLHVFWGGYICH